MLEDEKNLEPGGVELDINEMEWFTEHALAISKDEPMLKEVLEGDEHSAWSDAINAELTQMEKVNASRPIV